MPNKQAKPKRRIKVDSSLPLPRFPSPRPPSRPPRSRDAQLSASPLSLTPPPPRPAFEFQVARSRRAVEEPPTIFAIKKAGKKSNLLEPKTMRRPLIIPLLDPPPPLPRFDGTFCFLPPPPPKSITSLLLPTRNNRVYERCNRSFFEGERRRRHSRDTAVFIGRGTVYQW